MGFHARTQIVTPNRSLLFGILILLLLVTGCSQPNTFTRRNGMLGALKTNVAQLESEKDNLSRELVELRNENRRLETQLAEVDAQNGELSARLDDARTVISRQDLDDGHGTRSAADDRRTGTRKATPAKVAPKGRKSPFAQIPSDRREVDDFEQSDEEEPIPAPRGRDRDLLGPQSRLDDRSPWLPVARAKDPRAKTTR